jgi:flagellar basal-body rod protein FlgC
VSDMYEIAASGMTAQRTQMDLIAENLANAGVVRADGSVFHPKTVVMESAGQFQRAMDDAALRPALRGLTIEDNGATMSDVVFADDTDGFEPTGVTVAGIVELPRTPQYRFEPGNPYAAKNGAHKGYVAMPDVDPIEQMIALVASGRAYDADISMLQAAKQMDLEAADINRV